MNAPIIMPIYHNSSSKSNTGNTHYEKQVDAPDWCAYKKYYTEDKTEKVNCTSTEDYIKEVEEIRKADFWDDVVFYIYGGAIILLMLFVILFFISEITGIVGIRWE